MQFVANGPDIPDALLQAHEEGRVVFFCGAGISYPAGLPTFDGLVEKIYQLTGTTPSPLEQKAFEREQFDTTLDLLERRLQGQRLAVRRALAQALKPNLRCKGAIDTHASLLKLARSRDGALRLVTTNFDRVFEKAAKRTKQTFNAYAAPMLPVPKNSRWNGLVYLHGVLPEKADETALNRLIVTSGDFGLAYLTERWASRFVSELFRNYVVCFVGYSINDPVLRYMMDALAADRMLGETTPQAWALGDCAPGGERDKTIEWEAKGVTPILYLVPEGSKGHPALHGTLHAWAETYRDGVMGKERIVVSHALARPSASTRQDDFVGRMLWALSDKSGLPARRFAEFNPVPSLDWLLEAFSEERYQHNDLSRFGVTPREEVDTKIRFSLVCRPTPYSLATRMSLAHGGALYSQWDDVMRHLSRWLVRHLNDPRLIIWITQRGGQLHERWCHMIEQELDRFACLEREGKTSELEEIRTNAPNAIPGPVMRILWRLLLSGRVKSAWCTPGLYRWKDRLKRNGLTASLRLEFRELLAPKIALKAPFQWGEKPKSTGEPTHIRQLADWELLLAADHVRSSIQDFANDKWGDSLPLLLEDAQQLLRDTLDLLRELGEGDDRSDLSFWALPSISSHWQNRGFREWATLIELLRDSWLALRTKDAARSAQIAQAWFELPYPTFKRLALFGASQNNCIAHKHWVEWLLSDETWWLWAVDTQREVFRLIVLQGRNLAPSAKKRLERTILAGPRREWRDDLDNDCWQEFADHSIWLRLAKLNSSGLPLSSIAMTRLEELSRAHPQWKLADNESDEFSHWISGTGDPDYEESREIDIAPRKRRELVLWLKQTPLGQSPFYENTWREVCRNNFLQSLFALRDLANEGMWPTEKWRQALQVWSEDRMVRRSWRCAASLVQTMPNDELLKVAHSATWWLEAISKSINRHESVLLELCRRVLNLQLENGSGISRNNETLHQPVTDALNHPIGHVTQAILNLWSKHELNDNDKLPAEIDTIFTAICDVRVESFRHGRVLLGSRLIALFRVDRQWTERHLLPLFDWSVNPIEARSAWVGFLWSPRLYQPLLIALKSQFLESAHHYSDLGENAQHFAAFLTYAALGPIDGYSAEEFRSAIGELPTEGLEESAQALSQSLEGAAEQREEYWRNRIQPFWQNVWPKSRDLATPRIAESLTRMSIAAGTEFPAALKVILDWLQPIEHPQYLVNQVHESGICSRYPADALVLLNAIINDQSWVYHDLRLCLEAITNAQPSLRQNHHFQRLETYSRQRDTL